MPLKVLDVQQLGGLRRAAAPRRHRDMQAAVAP